MLLSTSGLQRLPDRLHPDQGWSGRGDQVLPVFTYEIAFGAQRLGEAIAVALYMLPAMAAVIIVLRATCARVGQSDLRAEARRRAAGEDPRGEGWTK